MNGLIWVRLSVLIVERMEMCTDDCGRDRSGSWEREEGS